ncbi:stress-activated map kinase interacting protein 1-domain-containing protein [Pisolithus sp. B1]|nr:stress-activated map kinase interacting protein 1-domain-containing protein [Pisolithus sp. B1]
MSLVNDPGYLVHSLRLSYLRNVDDQYGGRIISFSPSYTSNPYILAASLADPQRWPELEYPSSPPISDDETDTEEPSKTTGPTGTPRLKHHETIMGNRSGALGMRVNGRRLSNSKRASHLARNPPPPPAPKEELALPEPPAKEAQFTEEMEARRRLRMMARRGQPPGAQKPPSVVSRNLNPELSSSEGESETAEEENDEDSDTDQIADDMDEEDEFDPDFAATRTPGLDTPSDVLSILSCTPSVTQPSVMVSTSFAISRSRLSPVSEGLGTDDDHSNTDTTEDVDSHFEIVKPPPPQNQNMVVNPPRIETRRRGASISQPVVDADPSEMIFTRHPVHSSRPQVSALTMMLASSVGSSNPFSELYAAVSGRGETAAMDVKVFFPHARQPKGEAMVLNVRKDATVEEVIGFALWSYWEEDWLPKLNEGVGANDPKLSAVGWVMRIAEDDGEVDEDFPPPDRTGKISKFNFEAFAIIGATPTQIQQNEQLEGKIQRHPSRIVAAPGRGALPATGLVPPSVPGAEASTLFSSTPVLSSSLGPSTGHGPPIFLRIKVADTADAGHVSTTIPVSAGMYMQEALEVVCRKRKLANPKDYALILNDLNILIYLDRTVASLEGKRELTLVKRSMLPQLGIEPESRGTRTTDPNASIFKRISDVPEMQLGAAADYTTAYKRYTVYRKTPMLARQERTFAIDGVYVHIMPAANKAKNSVVVCQQSQKSCRDSRNKRYDFEADTPKLAGEIVHAVRSLKSNLERSNTVNKSRRSRQVS